MFGRFKELRKPAQDRTKYSDLYETMLYRTPSDIPKGVLPTIFAFRVKDPSWSLDPKPVFVLLETDQEIQEWRRIMAELVVLDDNGYITDAPLLRWNHIPSLLTADDEIITTYFPVFDNANWPTLAVQAHPFGAALTTKPIRDRYYFEPNKIIGYS